MRSMITLAVVLSFAAPLAFSAEAQTRLPRTSPAERKVEEINRSLKQEQRQLRVEEQIQIDNNQLRQSIDRQRMFSTPSPSGRGGACPIGVPRC